MISSPYPIELEDIDNIYNILPYLEKNKTNLIFRIRKGNSWVFLDIIICDSFSKAQYMPLVIDFWNRDKKNSPIKFAKLLMNLLDIKIKIKYKKMKL